MNKKEWHEYDYQVDEKSGDNWKGVFATDNKRIAEDVSKRSEYETRVVDRKEKREKK